MITKQVSLIATVAVIVVAFIGIGYAYTAFTVNSGNTTDLAYITVTSEGDSGTMDYTFADDTTKIMFDTYSFNDSGTERTYYLIKDSHEVGAYTCADLGHVILKAEFTGDGDIPGAINVDVESSNGFVGTSDWVYILTDPTYTKIYAYNASGNTWTDGPDALTIAVNNANNGYVDDTQVHLCYGYKTTSASIVVGTKHFLNSTVGPDELDGASIIFESNTSASTTEGYTITYKLDENADTDHTTTVKVMAGLNKLLTTDPFNQTDKTFVGWQKAGTTGTLVSPVYETINGDVTYYAVYNS